MKENTNSSTPLSQKLLGNPPPPYTEPEHKNSIADKSLLVLPIEDMAPPVYSNNPNYSIVMHLKDNYRVKMEYAPLLQMHNGSFQFFSKRKRACAKISILDGEKFIGITAYFKTATDELAITQLQNLVMRDNATALVDFLTNFAQKIRGEIEKENSTLEDRLRINELPYIEALVKAITYIISVETGSSLELGVTKGVR